MATPVKKSKRREEDADEDGDDLNVDDSEKSDDHESNGNEDSVEEEIQVEFEASSPEESDFHGIRALLAQLFLKGHIDISAMTSSIIAQNSVGSVLKQYRDPDADSDLEDGEDGVFGVTTCIPLGEKQNEALAAQLHAFLIQKSAENSKNDVSQSALKELLGIAGSSSKAANNVALLLNERFINIPPKIAIPTFESLLKDLHDAAKKNISFKFGYFVMILKKCVLQDGKKKKGKRDRSTADMIFVNPEEEFFSEAAVLKYSYSVAGERDTAAVGEWDDKDAVYDPWREVIVMPAAKLPSVMERIKQEIA